MTKLKAAGVVTVVVVLLAVLTTGSTWAQPGGKGGGGGRGMGMGASSEQIWAELCFGVNISATQIAKLKPTFAWAWNERNTTMRTAMQNRDMAAIQAKAAQIKSAIDKAIKIVLTKDQMATYNKWIADRQAEREKMRAQFGAGKGGGGGAGKGGGQAK